MNAANETRIRKGLAVVIFSLFAGALGARAAFAEDVATGAEARVSVVKQISRGGRDGARSPAARHEYSALVASGQRASARSKGTASSSKPGNTDFWFYDADVVLFGDDDQDGYFYGIDLLFDADSVYDGVAVYAVAFLSLDGGPWNEYAVTDDFFIDGATSDDEYVIVTELESGYPAGSYDLLVELYDAIDGSFLASFGPLDSSELSYLPLEDFRRDEPFVDNIIVVGHGGGGSGFGLLWLLAVPLLRLLPVGARASHAPGA
ncbi:MAG: choice-of-anchor H family protein [Woeseia sp.]|jgi:hypothetical protein